MRITIDLDLMNSWEGSRIKIITVKTLPNFNSVSTQLLYGMDVGHSSLERVAVFWPCEIGLDALSKAKREYMTTMGDRGFLRSWFHFI